MKITLYKTCVSCGYRFGYNPVVNTLICPDCKTEYKKEPIKGD